MPDTKTGSSGERLLLACCISPEGGRLIAHGVSRGKTRTSAAKPRRGDTFDLVSRDIRESRHDSVAPSGLKTLLVGLTHGSRRGLLPVALRAENTNPPHAFHG